MQLNKSTQIEYYPKIPELLNIQFKVNLNLLFNLNYLFSMLIKIIFKKLKKLNIKKILFMQTT